MRCRLRIWLRFLVVVGLLLATALFLHSRSQPERLPAHKELSSFPLRIGDWTGRDVPVSPDVLGILGPGEFLLRLYTRLPSEPFIDFFVAFFPSQRMGSSVHSPQNCLPGAGWTPVEASHLQIMRPGTAPVTVNRYVIAKRLDRRLVLYWYQSHGRVVANEYWAKFFLVSDSIRLNRSDGALIRIIAPVDPDRGPSAAERSALEFAKQVLPLLDSYVPR